MGEGSNESEAKQAEHRSLVGGNAAAAGGAETRVDFDDFDDDDDFEEEMDRISQRASAAAAANGASLQSLHSHGSTPPSAASSASASKPSCCSTAVVAAFVAVLLIASAVALLFVFLWGDGRLQRVAELRLNEIQMMGTHNSYHIVPPLQVMQAYEQHDHVKWVLALNYSHVPIPQQLAAGYRHFELDLYYDPPPGGRYKQRAIDEFAFDREQPEDAEMRGPGYKVLHMNDIDYLSTCKTFIRCLRHLKEFSDANPGHFPISVKLQMETYRRNFPPGAVQPIPMTHHAFRELEKEILIVFSRDRIITPASVKGGGFSFSRTSKHPTYTWPSLREAAGKVMFVLIMNDASFVYTRLNTDPNGPFVTSDMLLFPSFTTGDHLIEVDAVHQFPAFNADDPADFVADLVSEGHFVLSRADVNTIEAREDNSTRLVQVLASGAHVVQTDYPFFEAPNPFGTKYVAMLPNNAIARCNPVSAPSWCFSLETQLMEPIGA